jgi:hypothetical protein
MKQLVNGKHQLLYPDDDKEYNWNESILNWEIKTN